MHATAILIPLLTKVVFLTIAVAWSWLAWPDDVQAAVAGDTAAPPPSIVYILADDMGYGDVGCCNADGKIATPNLDRLSREGMRFIDAHTNSSVCTPTRYGILTGRYCWRTAKKNGVLQGHSGPLIDPERETVASLLQKHGYATACIGKWHLGMNWSSADGQPVRDSNGSNVDFSRPITNGPLDLGFDYFFGISASLNMPPHAFIENRRVLGKLTYLDGKDDLRNRNINGKAGWVADSYQQESVLSTITRKTVDWLERHNREAPGNPFFVYMPLSAPHAPIVPSPQFRGESPLGTYGDYCMEVDWSVGQVLASLDNLDVSHNTLVVFTSDNGPSPQAVLEHLQSLGHFPAATLRGLKGSLWEGGHRVPFVVRWPALVQPGSRCDQVICTTDLLATCAELLDVQLPQHTAEDSTSFLPALRGHEVPGHATRGIVHHSDSGRFAIRRGNWKLILDRGGGTRRQNPKDRPIKNPAAVQLFDMKRDASETANLQQQRPDLVKELSDLLARYIAQGRSTKGAPQQNDPVKRWPQTDVLREVLPDDALVRPGSRQAAAHDSSRKPNIVFVLFDDLGFGQPPCYRADSPFLTPHIDRLAREGMRFTDAHSAAANCTPTRYGVLTGRYPSRIGQFGVLKTYSPPIIPHGRLTVASFLQQQSYHTACIGKWHLGMNWVDGKPGTEKQLPIGAKLTDGPHAIGFDYFLGYTHARNIGSIIEQDAVVANVKAVENQPLMIRKAVDWIEKRAQVDEPFFLYFPMCPPHTPIAPAPEFVGKSGVDGKESRYADWVYQGDHMLGQILDALDRTGQAQDTLIIATGDNGAAKRPYPPLRAAKSSIYEGGHREPFVARWPGQIKPGSVCHHTICLNDLLATCADMLGVELPATAAEDSVSILPCLLGTATGPVREATVHQAPGGLAIRQGPWKLVFLRNGQRELYNLNDDLGETNNVAATNSHIVRRLTKLMQSYIDRGRSTPGPQQENDFEMSLFGAKSREKKKGIRAED